MATATDHNGPTEYTYDANGNIIHTQNYSAAQDFAYDALGQLTSYRNIYRDTYAYTYQNGNILTATKNGETYHTYGYTNAGWSDLLTSFDGGTITYDAIGNPLTYHDGKTFTWTAGRKLSTVTDGDSNYTYAYDGDGNRISKTVDGQATDYYYIDGKLLGLKKGQDTLLFLYDETGTAYGFLHNGTLYYYDINLQGDVVGIYNGSGNLVASYTYDVWGAPELTSDNAIATLNPLRYRGYFYDEETGFYYLQSRYYDPEVGRFINADGETAGASSSVCGFNLYAYCFNNPMNMMDPTGHWPKWMSNIGKAVKNVVKKVAKTVLTAMTSFTAEAGFGTGLRASYKNGPVEFTGGYKYDVINVKVNSKATSKAIDVGQEEKSGVVVKAGGIVSMNVEKGFYHSNVCEFEHDENHTIDTCSNTIQYDGVPTGAIEIIGFEAYCFIGGSFSITFDDEYFWEETVMIWNE